MHAIDEIRRNNSQGVIKTYLAKYVACTSGKVSVWRTRIDQLGFKNSKKNLKDNQTSQYSKMRCLEEMGANLKTSNRV